MIYSRTTLWLSYVVVLLFAASAWSQTRKAPAVKRHVGIVTDWTSSHIVVSGGLTPENIRLAEIEPRIRFQLAKRFQSPRIRPHRLPNPSDDAGKDERDPVRGEVVVDGNSGTNSGSVNRRIDWSVPLGAGNIAPYQYPAKYGYNPEEPPSCSDYVVFPLNVVGVTKGQANLLGINNLYSGPVGSPPCGDAPTVYWAYNGSTANGSVLTSPVPSLDGTKVLYIESAASSSIFHVLTWVANQGASATDSAAPVQVGSCTESTSCLTSLTYSNTSTDSATSPWIDYSSDKVFVTSDDGTIYRISCAFTCPLNTNPTVDWSFKLPVNGTGGSAAVPTQIIYDGYNSQGYLIVSDSLGEVWTLNASGSTPSVAFGPVMVGGGGCSTTNPPGRTGTLDPCTANGDSYGIAFPGMLLDVTTEMIYAFSGNDGTVGGPSAVVVQMPETLSSQVAVSVGLGSVGNTSTNVDLHIGQFNNTYWSSTPSDGYLILCGTSSFDTSPWEYWIGFSAYPVMDSTATAAGNALLNVAGVPCSGYTEFYNLNIDLKGETTDHDLLASGLIGPNADGNILTQDISWIEWLYPEYVANVNYAGGVSGIVIDNDGSQPEESSLYFSTQGVVTQGSCDNARCAVKLTQLNLN